MDRMIMSYLDDLVDLIDDGDLWQHYSEVLTKLYDTEFISVVDEDVNRIIDAKNLRQELHGPVIRPISVLEVMIALAKRCHEDIMYGYIFDNVSSSTGYWFWIMMENSGLDLLINIRTTHKDVFERDFNYIMDKILNRKYDYYGNGGFFPLHHPEMDQRFCELWYQMNAYLVENYPF